MLTADQEIRSRAAQAAAIQVASVSGDINALLYAADVIAAFIANGGTQPPAQRVAEEARQAPSRSAVEAIRQKALEDGLLDHDVRLGMKTGPLEDYLKFRWNELPPEGQAGQSDPGLHTDLGL
jgi:hypothetical protein